LDENIAYGEADATINSNCNYFFKNSFKIKSDAFYINLDDDPNFIPEIYVGRITRNFLNIQ